MVSFPSEVLEALRIHLEEEKKRLVAQMSDLSAQDPFTNVDRASDKASSDTEASDESSHDRFTAMLDEMKRKLKDTDEALSRIGNGTYGYCAVCGDMIDTDRLSIIPTATVCLRHSK
jgi:RNA polymerase-binding transcription factor DksA